MRVVAAAIALKVFLLTFSPSAFGQSAVVQVTASESGNPLPGVFVSLLDLEGRVVRSGLSNEAGRFVFPLARKDTFRVKAELMGRETRVSGTVAPGDRDYITVSLALPVHAIALDAIRVDSDARCRLRPDDASEIIRLWEEVRKALTVQAWSEREGLYRLDVSTYERDLDDAGRVEREDRRGTSRVTRVPFASLPAQELTRGGFVRPLSEGGYEYHGPDAALLLSDDFLDTHCFRATRSLDHQGAVGLAFEPVRAGEFSDIRGTLWVDEVTAALRLIEFRYTQVPHAEGEGIAGGRVEFERLPDGAWMIQKWWIRAPILVRHHNLARAGDTGIRVAGIRETGGEVVGVSSLERRRITQVRRGSLRGVVWDSSASEPLVGATVYLVGTQHRVETDSAGRFMLNSVPDGLYTVGFTHARLDTLGFDPPGMEAEVTSGATVAVELAIPPMETLLLAACRNDEQENGGAVLSGTVTDEVRGGPVPGARVRMEWQEFTRVAPVLQAVNRWLEVGTDSNGRYTACGVPIDVSIRIRAILLKSRGPEVEARFSEAAHQPLDLVIALPAVAAVGRDDLGVSASRFAQGVQGTVVDRQSGDPITAEVSVRDASGKVVATGVTNERGFFRLPTATPGRYFLFAEALGYGRIENAVVEVTEGRLSEFEIGIAREALKLEPVVVVAESRSFRLELEGFYRRMDFGFGKFMTPEIFEDRRPRRVSDLLYGVPGAYVADPNTGMGGRAVYFRSGIRASSFSGGTLRPSDVCWPMIYVDRQLVSNGGQVATGAEPAALDETVHPSDVWAMEVYRSAAEVPPEFNGANAGCGVIVLWTRRSGD